MPLLMRWRQWMCMRWCAARSSGVPRSITLAIACLRIALRVAVCHCCHSPGPWSWWSACSSSPRQSGHRPCWRRSRCQVAGSTGSRARRRRWSQYPVRAGSSRRRPPGDHPVPDDFRPGELAEVEAGLPAAEHPLVLPGRVEHAEVPGDDPAPRLVRVGELGPLPGQSPQVGIQRAEGAFGHPDPVVGGPPGDDRVEPGDHRVGAGAAGGPRPSWPPAPSCGWPRSWSVTCAGPGTSGPSRDRCSAPTGSGWDFAVSARSWELPAGTAKSTRPGPGRLRGSKNRPKTRPPIYRKSDNKHTTHSRATKQDP